MSREEGFCQEGYYHGPRDWLVAEIQKNKKIKNYYNNIYLVLTKYLIYKKTKGQKGKSENKKETQKLLMSSFTHHSFIKSRESFIHTLRQHQHEQGKDNGHTLSFTFKGFRVTYA